MSEELFGTVLVREELRARDRDERLNVSALLFDPRLARPFLVEWERVARALVARLHRETLARPGDAGLAALLRSLFEYPSVPEAWSQPDFGAPSEPVLTLRLRRDELDLAFLTTLTVFNAPQNVTLEELCIESYFPLDEATAAACQRMARDGREVGDDDGARGTTRVEPEDA